MLTMQEIALSFSNARDDKKLPGINKIWSYLAERGITRDVADQLGLHILPAVELIAAARRSPNINAADGRGAVVFPHYKLGSKDSLIEWWSSRLVQVADTPPVKLVASFGDFVDPDARAEQAPRWGKMFCPPNEPPHAYLPPIYNWATLQRGDRVYIHESAIKAINGALLGLPSVGLNGVWGWRSRKHDIALVEELRDLPWKALQLQPVIVFDSNAWDNWQVQAAESALATKLMEVTGRHATILRVPKPAEGDQGFDDYRRLVGDVLAKGFLEGEGVPADISELHQMLLQLNTEVCVVRSLGVIASQATGDLYTENKFSKVLYSNMIAELEDGEDVRQVPAAKAWLQSVDRVEVSDLVYAPGKPKLYRPEDRPGGLPDLNLWRGMGRMPEPGDVEPWLDIIANNVGDDFLREWLICWFAYPLQNLGAKILSYPLIFGPAGTGKNLLLKPLHSIYGVNSVIITRDNLKSDFNSIYAMRQLVHVDEIKTNRGAASDNVSQKIKFMISNERVVVNRKGQPEYEVANAANYVITDNFWDCIKLDQDDRRACVIRWDPEEAAGLDRRGDGPYWNRYVKWAEHQGPAALYDFLLHYDLKGFDPAAWAPETKWKQDVKESSMNSLEYFVHQLFDDPDSVIGLFGGVGKALFTARELALLHYQCHDTELTPGKLKALGEAMRNRGFKLANAGKQIRPPGGGNPVTYWVVRRRDERWDDSDTCKRHLKALGGGG